MDYKVQIADQKADQKRFKNGIRMELNELKMGQRRSNKTKNIPGIFTYFRFGSFVPFFAMFWGILEQFQSNFDPIVVSYIFQNIKASFEPW